MANTMRQTPQIKRVNRTTLTCKPIPETIDKLTNIEFFGVVPVTIPKPSLTLTKVGNGIKLTWT